MNILNLLTLTLFTSYLWFDVFEIGFKIKALLNIPQHELKKPWDCYTCTNGWIGIIIAIIWFVYKASILFWMYKPIWIQEAIIFILFNYLIGNIIDHIKHT